MRNSITYYIICIVLGAIIGWLCRGCYFRDIKGTMQRDTVVKYEKIPYSRLELAANTYKLDLPKTGKTELVFIPEHSTTIIYRDSVRYVTYPRDYFYTSTNEVEIWYSGIDSTIDSLNVIQKTANITETYTPREKRSALSIGIEANYSYAFRMPLQAKYAYKLIPWLSVYGYAEYEPFTKQFGAGLGTEITIEF